MQAKPLWEQTRDLHHACESHPVGRSMSTGKPPWLWYSAWLVALHQIHTIVDQHIDPCCSRSDRLLEDINSAGLDVEILEAADRYTKTLTNEKAIAGAAYVLTGAHLMGGEIMRKRLEGYPTKHLEWEDRKQSLAVLQQYRTRDDITREARDCFQALLSVMDEIYTRHPIV